MWQRCEDWLERQVPGMGLRATLLTASSLLLMLGYWLVPMRKLVPAAFLEWSAALTGIPYPNFHKYLADHLWALVLLMVVPLLISRFALKLKARDLGLGLRGAGREFLVVGALYALFVPLAWFASTRPGFQNTYPRMQIVETMPWIFLAFHVAYLIKWVAWEFFFRGFLLLGFWKDFQGKAVLMSTVPFVLMHYGKPRIEVFAAILAGLLMCWLVVKGRSIWPGVLLHWGAAMTVELFSTQWFWALFS